MQPQEYLTVTEVAERLRIHPVTVQKFCRTGKLPSERIGRVYRIPMEGFEDFMRAQREAFTPKPETPEIDRDLSALITAWLQDAEFGARPCSPDTIRNHRKSMLKYIQTVLGTEPDASITLETAFTERAMGLFMSRIPIAKFSTRYNCYMAVMSLTRFLSQEGIFDEAERLKLKRFKPKRVTPPRRTSLRSTDEVNRFFEAVWESDGTYYEKALNAAVAGTMVFAGLRVSEAAGVNVEDLDLANRILHVQRGKGGKQRMVGINAKLLEAIEAYLRVRPESGARNLFLSTNKTPLTRDSLNKRVRRIGKRAGFDVSCHGLRRTFATLASRMSRPLEIISRALGHSSISTTQMYLMTTSQEAAIEMAGW